MRATPTLASLSCPKIGVVILVLASSCNTKQAGNSIVLYMNGAELQIETMDQRQELQKALTDILTLSPEVLRQRRYADYQLTPNKWTIVEILQRYYVPPKRVFLNSDSFFKDVISKEAHQNIQKHLNKLTRGDK